MDDRAARLAMLLLMLRQGGGHQVQNPAALAMALRGQKPPPMPPAQPMAEQPPPDARLAAR